MTTPEGSFVRDVAQHSAWMRRLARALVGDAAADDVVQDTWAKLGATGARPGYVAAIVRSLALRRLRGEQRRSAREQRVAPPDALPSAADVAARSELVRKLAAAVDRLDEPYRTTVVLRYYDDLSSAEIARRAGVPAATVRARLMRGLDMLRARLDDEGGGRERWLLALAPWVRFDQPVKAGSVLAALVAMKTLLSSLLAVSVLVFAWFAFASGSQPQAVAPSAADDGARATAASVDEAGEAVAPERQAVVDVGAAAPPSTGEAAATVRARAVDTRHLPLPHAWLQLVGAPARADGDGDGRLRLDLDPGELERIASLDMQHAVQVLVGAPGRRTRMMRDALAPDRTSLHFGDVVLEAGGTLAGRVVDETGMGVEGAVVVFGAATSAAVDDERAARQGPQDLRVDPWDGKDPAVVGTSGPGGEFLLEGVPVGFGTAWARTATGLWTHSAPIGVRVGEHVHGIELVVRDTRDATITGRVVDPDGRPLPGIMVWSESENGNDRRWTDARGAFYFAPLAEPQRLRVESPRDDWRSIEREQVAAGTHDVVLAFEPCEWLHVAAIDAAGRPVVGGRVTGVPATGPTSDDLPRCQAPLGADGTAMLPRPEQSLRVRVAAPGFRDALVGPFDLASFPDPLTVTLERVPALTGRVLGPDGRPARGAVVSLHRVWGEGSGNRAPGGGDRAASPRMTHQSWGGDRDAFVYAANASAAASATADERGAFVLPLPGVDTRAAGDDAPDGRSLPPTRGAALSGAAAWYVRAAAPGFATATSGPHEFDASRDAEVELSLQPGGAIAGKLVLGPGMSPAGWTAYACDGVVTVVAAPVGEHGEFEFQDLHPGGWQVRVFEPRRGAPAGGSMRAERTAEPDVQVEAGRTVEYEHVARPRLDARLLGRIRIDGEAPGAARVHVSMSTQPTSVTSLDPDGCFELALQSGQTTYVAVALPGGAGTSTVVTGRLVIAPGANEWSVDVATAEVKGSLQPGERPRMPRAQSLSCETQVPGATVRVAWPAGDGGAFGPIRVAAGHAVLKGPPPNVRTPPPVLVELDLLPGESRDLGPLPR